MIRFAHITDLHACTALPGEFQSGRLVLDSLLPRALDAMQRAGCRLVALTGDLLHLDGERIRNPQSEETLELLPAMQSDYLRLKERLDACGMPCMILPGNHDFEPVFWQTFPRNGDTGQLGEWEFVRFMDVVDEVNEPFRIGNDLERWEAALESPRPQVHLQHSVIAPEIEDDYPFNYHFSEALRERMATCGKPILSLSGHYHPGTPLMEDGDARFATCPAFCEAPHRFRIFEIEGTEIRMLEESL